VQHTELNICSVFNVTCLDLISFFCMLSVEKHTLGILRVTDSKVMVTENFSGEGTPVDSSLLRLIYRAIQKKIPQHENSDILHSGRKISYEFFLLIQHVFLHKSA